MKEGFLTVSAPLLLAAKDLIRMCVTRINFKKVLFKAVRRQAGLAS